MRYTHHPPLCREAGADPEAIPRWIEVGLGTGGEGEAAAVRRRLARPRRPRRAAPLRASQRDAFADPVKLVWRFDMWPSVHRWQTFASFPCSTDMAKGPPVVDLRLYFSAADGDAFKAESVMDEALPSTTTASCD